MTAVVLACGLVFAVASLTVGVVYDAIASAGPGLSDNATQVLVAAFGGIIGILGTYIGMRVAGRGDETTTAPIPAEVARKDIPPFPAGPDPEEPTTP